MDAFCFTPRPAYVRGETIQADLKNPDGGELGPAVFQTLASPGGGFAGQVWRCAVLSGDLPPVVALKALRPRSDWKTAFRDALFGLCFQTSFAPRLREEALRAGLLWQGILARAAASELGPGAVARPLAYFWDPGLAAFVEVAEWIDSRPLRLEADPDLLRRPAPGRAMPEPARLKHFMDRLAGLCRRAGAPGVARQFAWFSFISQSNVLVRPDGAFTAVDCRPGLAFPFFLPFTPAHLWIALRGLFHGILAHFADIDLARLAAYAREHPALASPALLAQLRADEAAWRAALPDLWNQPLAFLTRREKRRAARLALCQDWLRLGWIDPCAARRAAAAPFLCLLFWLAAACPPLLRLLAHRPYRAHLKSLLSEHAYRRAALAAWTARDLALWSDVGRVPAGRPLRAYLFQKLLLAPLPPAWQRFCVDPPIRAAAVRRLLIQPLRLLFSQPARRRWLAGLLQAEFARGAAGPEKARDLLAQLHEPHLDGFIRDLGFTFGLEIVSRLVYLGLTLYGLSGGDYLPLWLALLSPIPPSGPLRFLYILIRFLRELPGLLRRPPPGHPRGRLLLARLGALVVAPLRGVGNLFPLIELSAVYPRLAFLLAEHFIARAAALIPVFGGRGRLLEIWIFQLCFNLPLSLRSRFFG